MFLVNDILRRAASINASGAAIIGDDGVTTWSEILSRVQRLAGALRARGLRPGDRVAILALNGPRYYEFMFAVIWAGGVVIPINTRFADREILFVLNDLDGPWVCADDAFLAVAERLRDNVLSLRGFFHIGSGPAPADYVGLADLIAASPGPLNDNATPSDLVLIYYTGGTTGISKGVMLTHVQVTDVARQLTTALRTSVPFGADSVYVHAAPMFHMADGAMCFATATVACANTFITRFDIAGFVRHIQKHEVSWATLVPTMIKTLCDYLTQNQLRAPSLKGILYGGAPMPPPVLELAMATLPGVQLFQGYGSTEALIVSVLEPQFHVPGEANRGLLRSAGRPLTGVLVNILDESGREVPVGKVGEICVRSNSVMTGYWRRPELTQQALAGNWLHTGDAGYLNERGFIFIVDRVKDMVISGGENVYAKEVEDALLHSGHIEEVAVIGLPHAVWGEVVHAIIRLKDKTSVTHEELDVHCRALIAGYKVPKSFEFVTEQLPQTSLGKIDKVAIRAARRKRAAS